MNQNPRESLSALMDSEADDLELPRVLKSLDESGEVAETWRRYHLARSLMQRDRDLDVTTDLSAGIMARLADEPVPAPETPVAPARGLFSRVGSFAGSAAAAAAVSLMVITGVQYYNASEDGGLAGQPGLVSAPGATAGDAGSVQRPSLVDLPLFQSSASDRGLINVGAGIKSPMMMSPSVRQSQRADHQQARLLQSYLDRHAQGAAYGSGDAWMPLLRASGQESLGLR
ncbi:sigma-E factor negative regulatory protein [Halomonas sp. YLGW01]|uniref:sigma-E factor negative regulatory protein n=1 Tax=Halomonas sp. YLGW01 TaxID=2773308 RepID=UPI001786BA69|nr:sigma-E factor negative regulatory protein [Halomonas sp. YLGW01]